MPCADFLKKKKKEKTKKEKTCRQEWWKKMDFVETVENLKKVRDAVEKFRYVVNTTQAFGPDSLPKAMSCGEANAFAELMDALGLPEEASDLRRWHLESEGEEEKEDNHESWTESMADFQ